VGNAAASALAGAGSGGVVIITELCIN
jgi:hypothetical protein